MANLPLEEMAPHIAYEVERLRFVVAQADFKADSNHGGVLRESFLVHFRNLIDFFYAPRKYPTDAVAGDYSATWKPSAPTWWKEDKERCNMLLNHPTYDRVKYEKTGTLVWKGSFQERAAHLQDEWRAFLVSLPPERRAWFKTDRQEF